MCDSGAKPVVGIVCTVLSALVLYGLVTFAHPCVHDDGSVSVCVWAQRSMVAEAIVALVLSLVRIFERDEGERRGLDLGIALVAALIALSPGNIIELCMMETMRCHTLMAPFARILGVLVAVLAGTDLVRRLLSLRGR